jgi:uncharacterized protein YbaR (Trm112 family)
MIMDDISLLREARAVFATGGNISQHFKHQNLTDAERLKVIEYAYDLQSGSYTEAVTSDAAIRDNKQQWGARIAELLAHYGIQSALDAGVGEASTLRYIAAASAPELQFAGFDISLSRLCFARRFLQDGNQSAALFTGDLGAIPVLDNAYDAVLSNHSLESNGGREQHILAQMLRATRRYLILIEPDYERGSEAQQQRMDSFGYVRGLRSHLEQLGALILCDEPWHHNLNPLNAASLIIAEKPDGAHWNEPAGLPLASPFSAEPLEHRDGYYYAHGDGLAFPVIDGFPCLLREQGVVATRLALADLAVAAPTIPDWVVTGDSTHAAALQDAKKAA